MPNDQRNAEGGKESTRDEGTKKALENNGTPTVAPNNTHGCAHVAMSNMQVIKPDSFAYWFNLDKDKRCCGGLDGKCANDGKFPVKRTVIGDKIQAYWCTWHTTGQCGTIFCYDCAKDRLQEEMGSNEGSRPKRTRR